MTIFPRFYKDSEHFKYSVICVQHHRRIGQKAEGKGKKTLCLLFLALCSMLFAGLVDGKILLLKL